MKLTGITSGLSWLHPDRFSCCGFEESMLTMTRLAQLVALSLSSWTQLSFTVVKFGQSSRSRLRREGDLIQTWCRFWQPTREMDSSIL